MSAKRVCLEEEEKKEEEEVVDVLEDTATLVDTEEEKEEEAAGSTDDEEEEEEEEEEKKEDVKISMTLSVRSNDVWMLYGFVKKLPDFASGRLPWAYLWDGKYPCDMGKKKGGSEIDAARKAFLLAEPESARTFLQQVVLAASIDYDIGLPPHGHSLCYWQGEVVSYPQHLVRIACAIRLQYDETALTVPAEGAEPRSLDESDPLFGGKAVHIGHVHVV